MTHPLVSIIVPIYNVEKYLKRCVDSLLAQSYSNLEIILVDDGSPDNCPVICDDYAERDHRVKVIHKPNGGLSDARNVGIAISKGEYITFVDSDDYVASDCIDTFIISAMQNNADIVCAGLEIVDGDGLTYDYRKTDYPFSITGIEAVRKLFRDEYPFNFSCGKLYHRELWDNVSFPKGRLYEDIATTYRVFSKASKIVCLVETLYYYEQGRPGNITSELNSERAVTSYWHGCLNAIDRIRFCRADNRFSEIQPLVEKQLYIWSKLCIDAALAIGRKTYNEYCNAIKAIINGSEFHVPMRLKMILALSSPYYYFRKYTYK